MIPGVLGPSVNFNITYRFLLRRPVFPDYPFLMTMVIQSIYFTVFYNYISLCLLFQTMFFTKEGDSLQLLLTFAMQPNAPLVNPIITVLLFCYFASVATPNPITAIIALSTNSATPITASLFCFRINICSLFFGEGVTNSGSGMFFCTLSNTISPD